MFLRAWLGVAGRLRADESTGCGDGDVTMRHRRDDMSMRGLSWRRSCSQRSLRMAPASALALGRPRVDRAVRRSTVGVRSRQSRSVLTRAGTDRRTPTAVLESGTKPAPTRPASADLTDPRAYARRDRKLFKTRLVSTDLRGGRRLTMARASITEPLRPCVVPVSDPEHGRVCSARGRRREPGDGDVGDDAGRDGSDRGHGSTGRAAGGADSVGRLPVTPRQPAGAHAPPKSATSSSSSRMRRARRRCSATRAQMRQDDEASCRASSRSRAARRSSSRTPIRSSTTSSRCREARRSISDAIRAARAARARSARPALIKVYCHLHSQMSASIMVFDHPYFTTPAATTAASRSTDVPAGEYRLERVARAHRRERKADRRRAGTHGARRVLAAGGDAVMVRGPRHRVSSSARRSRRS